MSKSVLTWGPLKAPRIQKGFDVSKQKFKTLLYALAPDRHLMSERCLFDWQGCKFVYFYRHKDSF